MALFGCELVSGFCRLPTGCVADVLCEVDSLREGREESLKTSGTTDAVGRRSKSFSEATERGRGGAEFVNYRQEALRTLRNRAGRGEAEIENGPRT